MTLITPEASPSLERMAEAMQGHHPGRRFLVNITPTLQKLTRLGELRDGNPVSVQLVAVPIDGDFTRRDAELQLDNIELIITPVIVRTK